ASAPARGSNPGALDKIATALLPDPVAEGCTLCWHDACLVVSCDTKRIGHVGSSVRTGAGRGRPVERYIGMDTNMALDAILALRAIWQAKLGRVTLADLEIEV